MSKEPRSVLAGFNRYRSERGWVTRILRKLKAELDGFVQPDPDKPPFPPGGYSYIFELKEDLNSCFKHVEVTSAWLAENCNEEDIKKAETKLEECMKEYEDGLQIANKSLRDYTAPAPQARAPDALGQAQPTNRGIKPCLDLKPRQLTIEDTPGSMRLWESRFRSYYKASSFGNADVPTQQSFLLACLDDQLMQKISVKITETTEVEEILEVIRERFLVAYPIMHRRWNLLKHRQGPDEAFSDWMPRLMMERKEADFETIDHEEFWVMLVVHLTSDPKLQDEFYKIDNPTYEKLTTVAAQYENISIARRRLGSENVLRATRESHDRSRGNSQDRNNDRGRGRGKFTGECGKCRRVGHRARECRSGGKSNCTDCKRRGHVAGAWLCPLEGDKRSQSRGPGQSNPRDHIARKTDEESSGGEFYDDEDEVVQVQSAKKTTVRHRIRALRHMKTTNPAVEKRVKTTEYICSRMSANATPLLQCTFKEYGQKFEKFESTQFVHKSLPDTGSTKPVVSYNLARQHGVKIHKRDNISLSDASQNAMKLEGVCYLKVKPTMDNGRPNRNGKWTAIEALVSSSITDEVFLSWDALIELGVVPPSFPEFSSSPPPQHEADRLVQQAELREQNAATACKMASHGLEGAEDKVRGDLDDLFYKYEDVFAEDLGGGGR